MFKSANYAQVRCLECSKITHIYPDTAFEGISCDCNKPKPKPRAKKKETKDESEDRSLLKEV